MSTAVEPTKQWTEDYQRILSNPPQAGDILTAYGGDYARLDVEIREGQEPFIYGRVHVPSVVGHPLGWYLHSFKTEKADGWKCILLPKAREECAKKRSLSTKKIKVMALRVVRVSNSGQSLLCEVAEYDPE